MLSGLGTLIGKPLFMDKLTSTQSRLPFARICVEVTAEANLPSNINYLDENGNICTEVVKYEWMPSKCARCKTFGHSCEARVKAQQPAKQNQSPRKISRVNQLPTQDERKRGRGSMIYAGE